MTKAKMELLSGSIEAVSYVGSLVDLMLAGCGHMSGPDIKGEVYICG